MPDADGLPEETVGAVETFLDEWRVEAEIPGVSVAVVDRDGLRYAGGLGARNVETRDPATPDTLYPFGSFTKVLTGMAVLGLVDRGALALDDDVSTYVPYWESVPGDPITVADLLSHSSGVPVSYAGDREYLFAGDPPASPLATREDVRRHVNGASGWRITDERRFMYSNRGYKVLGELVEAVDGRSFEAVVQAEILDPLGMDRSTVGYGDPAAAATDAARGYTVEDGIPTPTEYDLDADRLGPASAGGLLGSVREVGRVVRCLARGGELDGTRVLDADLVGAMCNHQAPTQETVDGARYGCGYGPRIDEFRDDAADRMGDRRVVWHSGTTPGFARAYAGLLPDRGIGVTLAANVADVPIGALGHGVLALVVGQRPAEVVPYLGLREKLRAVAGTYEGYRGGTTVTVEPADSRPHLSVTYEDGPGWSFPAFPESSAPDEYSFYTIRPNGMRAPLEFRDTDDGMELRFNVDRLRRVPRGSAGGEP